MDDRPGSRTGAGDLSAVLGWAGRQYRQHLELVYLFVGFGLISLLLEFRFELLWELFDVDPQVGVTADLTPLRDYLSDPVVDRAEEVLDELFVLLVLGVVSLFLLTAVVFLFVAGITYLVAADELSRDSRTYVTRAVVVTRRLPALVAASVVGGTLIAAGTVLFVLPGLYLTARLVLCAPAIVIDGHGPIAGLRAGWRRSAGRSIETGLLAVGGAVVASLVGFIPWVGEALAVLGVIPVTLFALAYLYESQGAGAPE